MGQGGKQEGKQGRGTVETYRREKQEGNRGGEQWRETVEAQNEKQLIAYELYHICERIYICVYIYIYSRHI